MVTNRYILRYGKPVPEPDLMKWAMWVEHADMGIAQTLSGDVRVSTVFLPVDYNVIGEGPPVLFETMIFGGKHDQYQERYTSREAALEGHQRAVDRVTGAHTLE